VFCGGEIASGTLDAEGDSRGDCPATTTKHQPVPSGCFVVARICLAVQWCFESSASRFAKVLQGIGTLVAPGKHSSHHKASAMTALRASAVGLNGPLGRKHRPSCTPRRVERPVSEGSQMFCRQVVKTNGGAELIAASWCAGGSFCGGLHMSGTGVCGDRIP
jgi:hypothetical protein